MTRSLAKLQENYLNVDLIEMCKDSLQKLIDLGLVLQTKLQTDDCVKHCLEVTQLGKATFKGAYNFMALTLHGWESLLLKVYLLLRI